MMPQTDAGQSNSALVIRNVSHSFGSVKALSNVSFTVQKGTFCGLLGVNGAGKTTLFSLITRLYDSVSGTISVAGFDARRQSGQALSRLGVVFQSRALDGDLTLEQNLSYHAALHGIAGAAARNRIEEVLDLVKLADKAKARSSTLSGGQQRRAEIARALLHRPELLILDEATAGLDTRVREEVLTLIRNLIGQEGVSALFATHILEELLRGDHLVVLHKGKILADTTAKQFAGDQTLAEAFLKLTSETV